jgi:hypothetical protein
MPNPLPSPEYLRKLLEYDPDTGELFWRRRSVCMFEDGAQTAAHACNRWNSRFEALPAFCVKHSSGRGFVGKIDGYSYMAHRVAFAIHHGRLDEADTVLHINGNHFDNRASNLTLGPRKQLDDQHPGVEPVAGGQV